MMLIIVLCSGKITTALLFSASLGFGLQALLPGLRSRRKCHVIRRRSSTEGLSERGAK
jgi:hypothetical protein